LPADLDAAYRYFGGADLYLVVDQAGHVVAASSSEVSAFLEPFLRDTSPAGFFRSAPGGYYGFTTSADVIRIAVA
jgi:hypothetical protein